MTDANKIDINYAFSAALRVMFFNPVRRSVNIGHFASMLFSFLAGIYPDEVHRFKI